jgi:hypothetical protein
MASWAICLADGVARAATEVSIHGWTLACPCSWVFTRLQQAVQFVGVPGAPGFERLASVVLGDSGRDHPRRQHPRVVAASPATVPSIPGGMPARTRPGSPAELHNKDGKIVWAMCVADTQDP